MQTAKEVTKELLDSLPDDCTLDDIQYHLFVRRSVERGLQDIEAGRVLSVDDMERRVGQWLVSSGPTKLENSSTAPYSCCPRLQSLACSRSAPRVKSLVAEFPPCKKPNKSVRNRTVKFHPFGLSGNINRRSIYLRICK